LSDRTRTALLWLAAARAALSIAANPLAPALYHDHFAVLVLLRPTKDVLLAGGFLLRRNDVALPVLAVAAVPLLLVGVWHFFALGRAYGPDIRRGRALPGLAGRLLPPTRINDWCAVLTRRGAPLVVLGRLAAFPSTVVAAGAGVSKMPARRFLLADGLGGVLSFVEVVGAGYALGEAYEEAGPWLTGAGVVVLAVAAVLFGRWLRRA
jgi:membrane protein DedA with SNARE-associated domain